MIRDVLDEMKAQLEQNIAAKLEAQDDKYDDEKIKVSTEKAFVYVGERSIMSIQTFPAIVLIPFDSEAVELTNSRKDMMHNIAMIVLVVDADPESGQKRAWTILRAAENVFESQVGQWPLGVIAEYKTMEISYAELGGIQAGKDLTAWTSAIRCRVRERITAYSSTQV
jgi:hypothetical protein